MKLHYKIRNLWHRLYYGIKDRIWPYNILHIKTLDRHWNDRDQVLLHSMFQILVDFIEQEKPFEHFDWTSSPEYNAKGIELVTLYWWWKNERPLRHDPLDDVQCPPLLFEKLDNGNYKIIDSNDNEWDKACDESWKFKDLCDKEDKDNMIRLVNLKEYLWT